MRFLFLCLIGVCALLSGQFDSLAAPVNFDQPVVVALDADLSAVAAEGGEALRRGIEIALAEINAQGGLLGRKVILTVSDHRGNPARGAKHVEALAENNNLLAIFGGAHTPVILAQLPLLHRHNILMMDPWAAGTSVTQNGYLPNNIFRVSFNDKQVCQELIGSAKKQGIKRVALVLERTAWGRSNYQSLVEHAQQNDINIVSTQWINWRQKQFATEINHIEQKQAQGIILVANAPESVVVSNAVLNTQNPTLPILSHNGLAGGNFARELGMEKLRQLNITVIQSFHFLRQRNPASLRLLKGYQDLYGPIDKTAIPAVVGLAHAYDAMHLLAAAVKQSHSLETDAVRQALENLNPVQGAVKNYAPPFTTNNHEAFAVDDYFMTSFNNDGYLVPLAHK
ncbi:ABC transporter substrate-binding protein [Alteromonas sp. C1M14]|uniref:ABC transporter substrate-binding protein n=1 Tax=Alteromonas sp. C1M14 TaxID=2841567 RepID=UPI001C09E4B5|nr:ABC transporter substrate-binding protein [Alteromonas sp. C1M14]